jgi:hypothetical protein
MGFFRSAPDLPAEVRSRVTGRPLAAVQAQDGRWLVGSREALQMVDPSGDQPAAVLFLAWEQVHRADWDAESSTLRVEVIEEFGRPVTAYSFVLDDPDVLLELVRERVTASVLLQRRVELQRKRGFSVIARRSPTGRGEVGWSYEFDRGVDPADPEVMAVAEAALQDARESLGL